MTRQDQATQEQFRPETSRGHYLLEVLGVLWFVLLLLSIGVSLTGDGRLDTWIAPSWRPGLPAVTSFQGSALPRHNRTAPSSSSG